MSEFAKYVDLKCAGASPEQVWAAGAAEGLPQIALIRMIRAVFDLSLSDAKKVSVRAAGRGWAEHMEGVGDALERALELWPETRRGSGDG